MLRLTKSADYGVVLLAWFARERERELHSARDLADEVGLPLPTVSKILKALTRADFLESTRGVKGGYRLTRAPEEMSILQIVTALDGPIGMTECAPETAGDCEWETSCPTRTPWQRINRVVREALEKVTLADMAHDLPLPPRSLSV